MAVPEGGAKCPHPLADQVRGHDARKVQRQHHRHGGGSGGEKGPQRPAQIHIFGGEDGHHDADEPDVVTVEMHPPGNEIQRPRQTQPPPAVPGAKQDFGAKAKEGRPFQNRGERPLHPRPVFPRHGVAEYHVGLIQRQPRGKQRRGHHLTAGPQPVPEQRVFGAPQPAESGPHTAGAPPDGGKVKNRRGEQRQQQSVCKFKQEHILLCFFFIIPFPAGV